MGNIERPKRKAKNYFHQIAFDVTPVRAKLRKQRKERRGAHQGIDDRPFSEKVKRQKKDPGRYSFETGQENINRLMMKAIEYAEIKYLLNKLLFRLAIKSYRIIEENSAK